MKNFKKVFLLLLLPFVSLAQEEKNEKIKFILSADFNQGLYYDGFVRVRENAFDGTHLKLKENLDMSLWISPGVTLGVNLCDRNIFEFVYMRHYFKGTEHLSYPTWYNGTLYEPNSEGDIHRTLYRDFEWIWKARIYSNMKTNLYLRTSIHYERLTFFVDASIHNDSPIRETFEGFYKQQLPLPSIGIAVNNKITESWILNAEVYATYLPEVDTWMNEGGTISLTQSNADVRLNAICQMKYLSLSPGIWFKHFMIKEESVEDTNEFLINGLGYKLSVILNL